MSFWEEEHLRKSLDILIIGAGTCGLNSALFIREKYPKAKIFVVDKELYGNAASTKNAGFACFGSAGELLDDQKSLGWDKLIALVSMRYNGFQLLKNQIGEQAMHYVPDGGFEMFSSDEEEHFSEVAHFLEELNNSVAPILGSPFTINAPKIKNSFTHAIFQASEGSLNPERMMWALERKCVKKNIRIIRGCTITDISKSQDGFQVESNFGTFKPRKVVVTTNVNVFSQSLPMLETRPARAQVFVSQAWKGSVPNAVFHAQQGYVYFRFINNRLLMGGLRNLYEKEEYTTSRDNTPELLESLRSYAEKHLLHPVNIDYSWAGTMSVGQGRFPLIGEHNGIVYGLKMGGMGVAIGAHIGKKLSEYV